MSVTVEVPSALRDLVGGAATVPAAEGPLSAVLDDVAARYPVLVRRLRDETGALRRFVNVYLDGEDVRGLAGTATPVPAGARVTVLPSVAGG